MNYNKLSDFTNEELKQYVQYLNEQISLYDFCLKQTEKAKTRCDWQPQESTLKTKMADPLIKNIDILKKEHREISNYLISNM